MSRSISFTVSGPVDTLITIDEQDDGTLRFHLEVLGSGLLGDLRGLFFDLNNFDSSGAGLSVVGVDGSEDIIGEHLFEEGLVEQVTRDVNVKGLIPGKKQDKFDAGIEFGTSGIGKEDVSEVSFIISADAAEGLSLDNLDLADLGLRYTSVGDESGRDGSEKIAGQTSGIARNDAWEVDENGEETTDLLFNDTNGIQADGSRKTVISVVDELGSFDIVEGGFARTVNIDGLELGTIFVSSDGYATFTANGEGVDELAHDDIRTWGFTYETLSNTGSLATADVVLTIDGQNDQPEVFDVSLTVGEDDAFYADEPSDDMTAKYALLEGDGVTGSFVGTDIDQGDLLSFEILTAPTDAFGNQYGSVVNNNDGTFTFNPDDDFQFLEAGETRDVTFTYRAIDDSGVGAGASPTEETDTSEAATVTITVEGAYDAPVSFSDELVFKTQNQSMFGTGEALILQPALPFLGFDTGVRSLDATIIGSKNIDFSGIADVVNTVASWFTGKDDTVPSSLTTPGLSTTGSFEAKVGLQPYFYLTSGDVDSEIPVDIYFDIPRQVESGSSFTIQSGYTVDGGATFNTFSPNVKFGMDFVFDLDTDLNLSVTSSSFGAGSTSNIWDIDTSTIDGFKGELGEPGFNLFNFSAEDNLEASIELGDLGTLDLNFPVIDTVGTPEYSGADTLTSSGEDDVVVLDIDVDAVIAKLIQAATGAPIKFGDSDTKGFEVFGVNLLSFEYTWDLVSVNFISTLQALQEFSLEVMDLPLLLALEDGSKVTGLSMGDEILVDVPEDSVFDADVDGDADGLIDFDLSVDMEAIFSNLTSLGLDLELFTGLLRFQAGITSDLFDGPQISLFDGLIPSVDGNNDGYLYGVTTTIADDLPIATLFDETFDLEGWNTASPSNDWFFDVA